MKDNGKQQSTQTFAIDDATAKAIKELAKDNDMNDSEEHKFSILKRFFERDASPYLAELDKNDILKMNDLESYGRLIPLVWRRRLSNGQIPPMIKNVMILYNEHTYDHRVNTASLKRKRELATVHGIKNDSGVVTTDKQIASFVGAKR